MILAYDSGVFWRMILAPCAGIANESGVCVYKWVHVGILGTSELRIAKPCAWCRCIYLGLSPHQFETQDQAWPEIEYRAKYN